MERLTQVSFSNDRTSTVVERSAQSGRVGSVKLFLPGQAWFRRSSERRNRSPGQTSNGFFALSAPTPDPGARAGAGDREAAEVRDMHRS